MDGAERSARWDSYKTTAMRAYTPKKGPAAEIIRPYDTKHFGHSYKLGEPVGSNAYQDDYGWKPYSRAELIRTATSSGSRNHNPHPSQNFMRWKMPREQAEADPNSRSPWRIPASTRDFQRTISAQYTSTLREDFLDRTKAMALKQTLRAPPEWKTLIPRWPETEFRRNYGIPPKIPELQDFSWKYGCYSNLPSAVKGIVHPAGPWAPPAPYASTRRVLPQTPANTPVGKAKNPGFLPRPPLTPFRKSRPPPDS
ncbi:testis-expressed protein 26 isoform X3 [Ornithorhynchus anatinus]|uniref:testis-expressed protein 26 isoform X3 n=1 Tax=Ornithorhynchus anatinus TaxID=9258 RepID=UPI00045413B4|nr:testis-expressed protein 26 isoform X3 [Ornithorhynchus anatinus]